MENNKLIADFMGIKPTKGYSSDWHYSDSPFISINSDSYEEVENTIAEYVKYHTSWDWLMPVVEKIEDYLSDNVGKVGYFDECLSSNNLDVRYQAVIEFIKQTKTK